jgi:hypothetical protein
MLCHAVNSLHVCLLNVAVGIIDGPGFSSTSRSRRSGFSIVERPYALDDFGRDLSAPPALEARGEHIVNVVLDYLKA